MFGVPSAVVTGEDVPDWLSEVPRITHSMHGSDEDELDDSDGISPIENSSNSNASAHQHHNHTIGGTVLQVSAHHSNSNTNVAGGLSARKQPMATRASAPLSATHLADGNGVAPLTFNDSFVGNTGDESAFASPPPAARKQPVAAKGVPPLPIAAGKSFTETSASGRQGLGMKSPRPAKSLHFGGSGVPVPVEDLNYSSIRNNSVNLSGKGGGLMAAPAPAHYTRASPRAPPVGVMTGAGASSSFFHHGPPRSPSAATKHSQSMYVTAPGMGAPGGEDDVGNFSLHRQQQLSRTPRHNPYQLSPKSHLGSAKKKTRLSMVALTSRYVQDFEEERRLGKGNFSDVYQCKHVRDGLMYAVKILRGEGSGERYRAGMCAFCVSRTSVACLQNPAKF